MPIAGAILGIGRSLRGWAEGLPEWLWYVAGVLALVGGVLVWNHFENRAAVEDYKDQREQAASRAREDSAEQQAIDAVAQAVSKMERDRVIAEADKAEQAKPAEQRAQTSPQAIALNCAIAREDYTAAELEKMPEYQEHCR